MERPIEPPADPRDDSDEAAVEGATPARAAVRRDVPLGAIVFLAVLVLLLGGYSLLRSARSSPGAAPTPVSSRPLTAGASSSPSTAEPSSSARGSTAPGESAAPSRDAVLVGAGDIASCSLEGDTATANLIDGIVGTVFTAGDNAYDSGSDGDFRDCYGPTWGRFKDRTRPVAGNHDWETKNAQGYRDYFGDAALNSDGDTWYSFDVGAWHIVMLDANCSKVGGCDADSDEGRWLAADLGAHPATCTMAIWHQPRFSSGDRHGNDPEVDPFWRALYTAGADVVVNGHDHDYERFAPQDPDQHPDAARGIREFVVGTGGAELRKFSAPVANSELRLAVDVGVIKFTLHPRGYDWTWLSTGRVTDSGSALCH